MQLIRRILLGLITCGCCCGVVLGQNKPKAVLHVTGDRSKGTDQYFIEIVMDTDLKQSVFDDFKNGKQPVIGVLASKGMPVSGLGPIVPADATDRKRFKLDLDRSTEPLKDFADQKFTILLTDFKDDSGKNQIRAITVERELEREIATDFPVCRPQQLSMHFNYNSKNFARALEVYRALDHLKQSPNELAKIQIEVEPLTKKSKSTLNVESVKLFPVKENGLLANDTVSVCFETDKDVPTEKFDTRISWPTSVPPELVEPALILGLSGGTVEPAPPVFVSKEKAVGVRPIEKDLDIGVSLVSTVADVEQPDKSLLRKRTTRDTLDLRLGLFRNVTQLTVKGVRDTGDFPEQTICGKVGKTFTAATSTVMGTIVIDEVEIGIAPGIDVESVAKVQPGTQQCLHFVYPAPTDAAHRMAVGEKNTLHPSDPIFTPYIGSLVGRDSIAGTYSIFTPFYIDAKVSNGKIDKDTTSLNRIVFGVQEEFRYYQNNFRFPTYYRFVMQGNHASDRDFKQKEYKATFEFKPIFGSLNHPFDPTNTSGEKRQLCKDCKQLLKLIPPVHGFEFVPLVGAEIGRTYSRRKPAAALKPSDTVRRVYFGLDLVLNPTARFELKGSEQFYIRGESKTDRYHNYFLGEVSYRLVSFNHGRAAHSVFFSWEKGGQPPFEDPDVNVLKFGYRVAAATLFSR